MANSQRINSWGSYPDLNALSSHLNKFNPYSSEDYSTTFPGYSPAVPSYVSAQTSSPIPEGLDEQQRKLLAFEQAKLPYTIDAANQLARNQSNLTLEQMAASYPLISQAAKEAWRRNIKGTKEVSYFKDFLPTAQQGRMLAGSSAFSQEAAAMAAQQDAASRLASVNFLRIYAG